MTVFGAISYAAVGVLYAILSLLLLPGWRGQRLGGYLIAACVISTIWAATLSAQMFGTSVPAFAIFATEVLRSGAWLTFLIILLAQIGVSRYVRFFCTHGLGRSSGYRIVTLVQSGLFRSDRQYCLRAESGRASDSTRWPYAGRATVQKLTSGIAMGHQGIGIGTRRLVRI